MVRALALHHPVAELDVRAGGANRIVMRGPDGRDMPNAGSIWRWFRAGRIVFTDAFRGRDWGTLGKPFMTVVLTFEPEGRGPATTAQRPPRDDADARRTSRWASTRVGHLRRQLAGAGGGLA